MNRSKIIYLLILFAFVCMQVGACFVASFKTDGFLSILFFITALITCLFGVSLNFMLFVISLDIFSSCFFSMMKNLSNRNVEEEEEIEVIDDQVRVDL